MNTRPPALAAALVLVLVLASRAATADEGPAAAQKAPADATTQPLEPAQPGEGVGVSPAAETPKERTPEVVIFSKSTDTLATNAGAGEQISKSALAREQPVDVSEALRRVKGVQVREDYAGGSRLDISIRGLESGRSRRVLLLEDGVPMSLNPYSEPDMNYAPAIERYEAIDVVKGSGNILFGPQTLAGTINFHTLLPPDHQMIVADVDAGNYGYVRGLARYGDTIGDTRYLFQIVQRHGDGFRQQPFDSTDTLGKVLFPTGKDGEAVLRLSWHRDEALSDDVGLTPAMYAADPRRPTLAPHDHLIFDKYDVALTHEQRFSPQTTLKTLLYAYDQPRVWRRQDWTRSPAPGTSYERIFGDESQPLGAIYFGNTNTILDRDYGVVGLEPRAQHKLKTGFVEHTIDFGGRVLRETAHYAQRSGTYPDTWAGSNDYEESHTGTAFAGYVQDRMAFSDKFLVVPGIRYEHLEFRRVVQRQPGAGAVISDTYDAGSDDTNGVIPGIGTIYGTKTNNVFAGMHVGFAPPRITSAISAKGVPSQVHAEQSINYEVGGRLGPAKWARLEATAFLSDYNNQVVVGTQAGGDAGLADAGATNVYGAEASASLLFDKLLALPEGWVFELGARYTFDHATFRFGPNAGRFLPYAPLHSGNANLDFEHPSGFGGELAYFFVGKQYTDELNTQAIDPTGTLGALDPWNIVDLTVHYRHKPSHITIRFTAKNLLDSTYIEALRPNGIFAGPFRELLVGVRWEWDGQKHDASP